MARDQQRARAAISLSNPQLSTPAPSKWDFYNFHKTVTAALDDVAHACGSLTAKVSPAEAEVRDEILARVQQAIRLLQEIPPLNGKLAEALRTLDVDVDDQVELERAIERLSQRD